MTHPTNSRTDQQGQAPWRSEVGSSSLQETPPVWSSDRLLGGQKAVAIEHNGAVYRLQSTRAGKLILTK